MVGRRSFPFGARPICRGYVSFREGKTIFTNFSFGEDDFHVELFFFSGGWKNRMRNVLNLIALFFGEDAVFSTDSTPQKTR